MAVLFIAMFTYCFGANPAVDYPRLLVADTQQENHVFEDEEILAVTRINAATFQSGQAFSGPDGQYLPSTPVSYLRVAAMLLDAMAANKSKLASIVSTGSQIKFDSGRAAFELRATAAHYRNQDDNSGAFVIIQQAQRDGGWSFADLVMNAAARQNV